MKGLLDRSSTLLASTKKQNRLFKSVLFFDTCVTKWIGRKFYVVKKEKSQKKITFLQNIFTFVKNLYRMYLVVKNKRKLLGRGVKCQ